MSYLGLDVGTTGCKAVVFDEHGQLLAQAYEGYPILTPNEGWAELEPDIVCGKCMQVIRDASALSNSRVRAIGVSSQGEAFAPVGRDGELLGNAMVSSDTRAASIQERFTREFDVERIYRITGHTPSPMFTLFKLLWLKENRPDVWTGAAAFYCFEELIHRALGAEPAISWPLAGRTMMFDVTRHEWSSEILSTIGLDASRLARPLASGSIAGRVSQSMARDLGMIDGAIVVAGGHDQTCGALGAGVVSSGRAAYGIGTVECITPAFAEPVFSSELMLNNLATYDFTVRGMYTTVAYSLTGGNLLQWYRDNWDHRDYGAILDGISGRPTSLMVLPYFTPSGTPYFETRVPGAVLGLRLTTTREEVLQALLEGVAYEMRLNLSILERSGVDVNELVAIGGGANNRKWLQLKADVLNRPIRVASVAEAGCLGAAALACSADTSRAVTQIVGEWVGVSDTIEPAAANSAAYDERFAAYLELYPTLKSFYERTDRYDNT